MKKILFYLLVGGLVFAKGYTNKELIKFIEENEKYVCIPDKKVIKVERENYTGHFDEEGKPYGEWKSGDYVECDLGKNYTQKTRDIFYKETKDFRLYISKDEKGAEHISLSFENKSDNNSDINTYYFQRKKGKYKKMNKIMTYQLGVHIFPEKIKGVK